MSNNGSTSAADVVRKARRRAKFQAVRSALAAIFGLMLLSAAGGFAWGMWEEVSASPQKYRAVYAGKGASLLSAWSAKLARLIARMQPDEKESPPERPPASSRPATVVASNPSKPGPSRTISTQREPPTTDPGLVLPDPDLPLDPDADIPEPSDPEPWRTEPKTTGDPPPLPPPARLTKETEPATKIPGLDPRVAEALEKAHKSFDTAWKYHQKARPEAPPSGRDAANKMAIQYLKLAKQHYEAVLQQKIPADLRERIQSRLVDLNGLLYWSLKMSSIK